MKPNEKAEQLYRKYTSLFPSWIYLDERWQKENKYSMAQSAKKAALIAVEEIIEEDEYNNGGNALASKREKYWKEVKFFIEAI